MKITKIKKMSNNKYKIVLENGEIINTYDDVILSTDILYTKEITDEVLKKIKKEENYYTLYNKTIKYISKRLRSEYEVREYLNKYELKESELNKLINSLKESGYINDYNFVKAYTYDKFNLSSDGPLKIKKDLINFNIDESIINESINNIKEEDIRNKLNKIVSKRVKLDHKHSISIIKNKLRFELYNLGYENSMIEEELSNIKVNSNIDKEYDSIYKKLSRKYEGYELNKKLKEKLYQKGYSLEEINKKIEG